MRRENRSRKIIDALLWYWTLYHLLQHLCRQTADTTTLTMAAPNSLAELTPVPVDDFDLEAARVRFAEASAIASCGCGDPCIIWVVRKRGPNAGRPFLRCPKATGSQCSFFKWIADESSCKQGRTLCTYVRRGSCRQQGTADPVTEHNDDADNADCPVCMNTFSQQGTAELRCGHKLCLACYSKVVCGTGAAPSSNSCPFCRAGMLSSSAFHNLGQDRDSDSDISWVEEDEDHSHYDSESEGDDRSRYDSDFDEGASDDDLSDYDSYA